MTDTETADLKEKFNTHSSQEEGAPPAVEGHMEKHQGWSGGRRSQGVHGQSLYCGYRGKEVVRQGRQAK